MIAPEKLSKKRTIRLLKFLASGPARLGSPVNKDEAYATITRAGATPLKVRVPELAALEQAALVQIVGQTISLTQPGKSRLRRLMSQIDEFQRQHQVIGQKMIVEDGKRSFHQFNEAESPLSRLHYRKGRNGSPYIDENCFQAGERFRADFTRGQLVQQVTSNWNMASMGGGGNRSQNGIADLTDSALAARERFEAALKAIGPELINVMLDICCFLKGLEQVEREYKWPPRSAKLMLKTGLSVLSRHYGL